MKRQLRIADIVVGIDSKGLPWHFDPDRHYGPFVVKELEETVHVDICWRPLDVNDLGELVFSARDVPARVPPNWRLYRSGQGFWNLQVNTSAYPVFLQRVAVFQSDFRQGEVYVTLAHRDLSVYPYPLTPPLDRVLFVNVVTHGLGVMLHACGVVHEGKAYVFAGPSEAGKTTLARLWAEFGDATVLGDDCLILRKKDDRVWAYGTPWVGEAGLSSPLGAPVESVFFIHQFDRNLLTPTRIERAAEQLLAQSILTPYDAFAVRYGLDFCLDVVTEIPVYDFGFVPEPSAVRIIQGVSEHGSAA